MSFSLGGNTIGAKAAGDISSSQYKFVKLDSNGYAAAVDAAGEVPFGILQNNPDAAGESASVQLDGVSKAVAGAAIAARNTRLTLDNTGRVIDAVALTVLSGGTAVTSHAANGAILTGAYTPLHIVAVSLETAGAANDVIAVRIIG